MKYTYKTWQKGIMGAIGVVFRDGVQVWETRMLQSPRGKHDDRDLAGSACREHIRDLKMMDAHRRDIEGDHA